MKPIEKLKRNTAEIIGEEKLTSLIKKKNPVIYLGTSITGSPHIGYFVWAKKISDFMDAGFKAKILLADLHGALDNTPWEVLEKRYKYYEKAIPLLFKALGQDKKIEFIKGSSFQLSKDYVLDLFKLTTSVSVHDATKSASEVVKMGENPKLSGLIYPLMQSLDEEYLKSDVQCGGLDQRKIFVLASEILPKIGYDKRVHVMTNLIPGLVGEKMSSSIPNSKIDLIDSEEVVNKKINSADCVAGNPNNGIMALLKNVIFPIKEDAKEKFTIKRPEKYGGDLSYDSYIALEKDFTSKKVHPLDVKNTVAKEINILLKPLRSAEILRLHKQAYLE